MNKAIKILVLAGVIASFSSCLSYYINWEMWSQEHKYDKCSPDSTKMIGIWTSNDGATIELKEDGTCSVRKVKDYNYDWDLHRDTIAILNYDGYWCIAPEVQSDGKGVTVRNDTVYIDPSASKWDTIGYQLCLDSSPIVLSQNGRHMKNATVNAKVFCIHNIKKVPFGSIIPYSLYHFIGDPDDFDLYEFHQNKEE